MLTICFLLVAAIAAGLYFYPAQTKGVIATVVAKTKDVWTKLTKRA